MKILVTGGGGREHAIIKKLSETGIHDLFAAPGNGGIAADAECFPDIKATDIDGQVRLAKDLGVELVVIGPDDALALGLADRLRELGIKAFGPSQSAARLESSKAFSKDLMKKHNIPTAEYEVFDDPEKAKAYIENLKSFPTVIKADGLALGKGVIIAENKGEAIAAIHEIMEDKKFGKSGSKVVIEEFLTGPEISVFVVTDGVKTFELASAMDHKRAGDNDTGLNTGGMGTIAPNPFYTEKIKQEVNKNIIIPTVKAMAAEGCPFEGVIFFGLMATPTGVKVIEYNSRFGDPEAQVILPLFDGNFTDLLTEMSESPVENSGEYAACVVIASGGYPEKYETGKVIKGLDDKGQIAEMPDVTVFHAGSKLADGRYYTSGGRVLGITAKGKTLQSAITRAYEAVSKISFDGMYYRKDIGKKAIS
jgi:phosphoribosylamine--glycine ligase